VFHVSPAHWSTIRHEIKQPNEWLNQKVGNWADDKLHISHGPVLEELLIHVPSCYHGVLLSLLTQCMTDVLRTVAYSKHTFAKPKTIVKSIRNNGCVPLTVHIGKGEVMWGYPDFVFGDSIISDKVVGVVAFAQPGTPHLSRKAEQYTLGSKDKVTTAIQLDIEYLDPEARAQLRKAPDPGSGSDSRRATYQIIIAKIERPGNVRPTLVVEKGDVVQFAGPDISELQAGSLRLPVSCFTTAVDPALAGLYVKIEHEELRQMMKIAESRQAIFDVAEEEALRQYSLYVGTQIGEHGNAEVTL
jgi:hypothetical protein